MWRHLVVDIRGDGSVIHDCQRTDTQAYSGGPNFHQTINAFRENEFLVKTPTLVIGRYSATNHHWLIIFRKEE